MGTPRHELEGYGVNLNYRHADDASGLTWGGQTYETGDGRVSGTLKVEKRSVQDGVDIQATEVVLLRFS